MTSFANKSSNSFTLLNTGGGSTEKLDSDSNNFFRSNSILKKNDLLQNQADFSIKCLTFNETQKSPFLPKLPQKLIKTNAARYDSTHLINDFYVGQDYDKKVS